MNLLLFVAFFSAWNSGEINLHAETQAEIENYPYFAAIFKNTYGTWVYRCGGTIVNAKFILSAAECFIKLQTSDKSQISPQNVRAVVGLDNIKPFKDDQSRLSTPNENVREVKLIIKHPDYTLRNKKYDIAIIQLKLALKYSQTVRPVDLDDSTIGTWSGTWEARIAGFGETGSGNLSDQLMVINPYIESVASCLFEFPMEISSLANICFTYEQGQGLCCGDSGSGIVVKKGNHYLLIGVVTYHAQKNCGGDVDYGARVAHFKDWIDQIIAVW